MDTKASAAVRADPAFQELVRKRGQLGWTLAVMMLIIYYGFVFLVAFAPHLLGTPISSTVTLGFPLGLLVILSAIGLTGFYVVRANSTFDRLTQAIGAKHG